MAKTVIDKDLKKIGRLQRAGRETSRRSLGLAFLFLLAVWAGAVVFSGDIENRLLVMLAGVLGAYMALNIGANDVANNVGPAVGSRALTIGGALAIAAICEAAGAILAGGDVVSTISKGIIDPSGMPDAHSFMLAMSAALLAGALWLNIATWLGAPVSTTHSIVGGVMGAGIAVAGLLAVNWPAMAQIAASWVVSPGLGGLIAAAFLALVYEKVLNREDKLAAARTWVPVLLAVMAAAFTVYLMMKGLKRVWDPDTWLIATSGVGIFIAALVLLRPVIAHQSQGMPNRRRSVNQLFTVPLICAAALLSFAHGSNDVANAVGPLAAIFTTAVSGHIEGAVAVPFWIMLVGAIGISIGLALFGPRVIRTVGAKITKLNPVRAFCVALSAAITVIAASAMGLPVSSTHIAVGAVFGVGFYREFRRHHRRRRKALTAPPPWHTSELASDAVLSLDAVPDDTPKTPAFMTPQQRAKAEKKEIKIRRRKLVRRSHLLTIVAAWVITVPMTALLAGIFYFLLTWLSNWRV